MWQIFRDSCESKEHILIIDPRTWALFSGDLGEGTVVLYKGDWKCNFFDFGVGWAA